MFLTIDLVQKVLFPNQFYGFLVSYRALNRLKTVLFLGYNFVLDQLNRAQNEIPWRKSIMENIFSHGFKTFKPFPSKIWSYVKLYHVRKS